jgi:mRNA interferase RelE/StbE
LAWTVDYTHTARTQLKKLDKPVARRILDFMDKRVALQEDPRALGKALTGPLGALWRYRVGDYRVICEIQDGAVKILVVRIGHRGDLYR